MPAPTSATLIVRSMINPGCSPDWLARCVLLGLLVINVFHGTGLSFERRSLNLPWRGMMGTGVNVTPWSGLTGTVLNVAGILVGGVAGLIRRKPLSPTTESFLKVTLGAFTVFYGLRLTWASLNGSAWQILKQLLIVVLALGLGR